MKTILPCSAAIVALGLLVTPSRSAEPQDKPHTSAAATSKGVRSRARDLGIVIGKLPTGPHNSITDVLPVAVGHSTIMEGDGIRTGVTVIVPRIGENTFEHKVIAAAHVGNGFGKLTGLSQLEELGTLEAPIVLTNTLAVGAALDGILREMLAIEDNESVQSINVVVGETNDARLNDIRRMVVGRGHVSEALAAATTGAVQEGAVGAGTGTMCFGFKGGIGSSSRIVNFGAGRGEYTIGALVQTNFGGELRINGRRWSEVEPTKPAAAPRETSPDGSCMIIIATDAPLDSRQLKRIAKRATLALARVGSVMSHGSGDYAIAFSTFDSALDSPSRTFGAGLRHTMTIPDEALTKLFVATVDATEEAILNSLFMATTMTGRDGFTAHAIDLSKVRRLAE